MGVEFAVSSRSTSSKRSTHSLSERDSKIKCSEQKSFVILRTNEDVEEVLKMKTFCSKHSILLYRSDSEGNFHCLFTLLSTKGFCSLRLLRSKKSGWNASQRTRSRLNGVVYRNSIK
jgi:hypothetical protein